MLRNGTTFKNLKLKEGPQLGAVLCSVVFLLSLNGFCSVVESSYRSLATVNSKSKLSEIKPEMNNEKAFKDVMQVRALISDEPSLRDRIFDPAATKEIQERFDSINKSYEYKEAYNLNSTYESQQYQRENRGMVQWAMRKILQYHIRNTIRGSLKKSAEKQVESAKHSNSTTVKTAASALSAVTSVHKALQNTAFNIGEGFKTHFKYDLSSGVLQMLLTSVLVDADVNCRILKMGRRDGTDEKMNIRLSRDLSFLGASSVNYRVQNEILDYGLNRSIVGALTAGISQSRNMRDSSRDETMVRLSFGTQF